MKFERTRVVLRTSVLALGIAFSAHGQGYIAFNNYAPGLSPVTISTAPGTFNPVNGPAGALVGSNYSASLWFVSGIVTNQAAFDALNPVWLADVPFFGTTGSGPGHGIDGDGSGFFDGGTPRVTGVIGTYATFEVLAWYNGGGLYGSYAQAVAAGHNVGQSKLLPVYISIPPGPISDLNGMEPFTVGIPEPSTFVLAGLGGAALLLFRRRK